MSFFYLGVFQQIDSIKEEKIADQVFVIKIYWLLNYMIFASLAFTEGQECIVVHLSRQKIRHFIMNLIIQATASASSSSIAGK